MKLFLGINVLKAVDANPYVSHLALTHTIGKQFNEPDDKIFIYTPARCSIDRMRNESARLALEYECDYLMFVDDDVVVESNTLKRLIQADADIAMAETYIRGYPFNTMFFKQSEDGNLALYDVYKKNWREDIDDNGLLTVDAVGFSCVLIKCDLLKKLTLPFFVTDNGIGSTSSFTEDVYFCLKAIAELGRENLKIVVDTKVRTGHQLIPDVVCAENAHLLREYAEKENEALTAPVKYDRGDKYAEMAEDLFQVI